MYNAPAKINKKNESAKKKAGKMDDTKNFLQRHFGRKREVGRSFSAAKCNKKGGGAVIENVLIRKRK